MEHTWAS